MMRSLLVCLALAACSGAATSTPSVPTPSGPQRPPNRPEPGEPRPWASSIPDDATWQRLAARPQTQVVSRTEVVKLLMDLSDERRVYFVDTALYDIHYYFARDHLAREGHPIESHGDFNLIEYRRAERRFVLGSIVHYLDSDLWTFEMIAGDNLPGERVLDAFQHIRSLVHFGDRLRYRPISELHEQQIASVRGRLPTVTAEQVFAGVRYQPLMQGVGFGTLRIVRGRLDPTTVRPDQILVLEQLPDEIPVPAAVVTAQLQAPLGHIALLCANRGTPNMGLRDALTNPRITALDGRLVRLEVGMQDFILREASRQEAEDGWALRRPAQPLVPRIDPAPRELTDVCNLRLANADFAGAKASQLGEVCSIGPPIHTPGGFVVPFAHYLAHLQRTGAATGIAGMLTDQAFRSQAQVRAQRLTELRTIIERSPVDPALLRELRARIARFPNNPRVILRSSTNAEDLPGFTGAGLYRSLIVAANASDAELARALREVWSSVWLQGAYEEREWYRVDQSRVAMAVLVQPFVDGAVANGVALTNNPYFEGRPAYFINAQALGGSVTGATGDEIPEQYLVYTYSEDLEMELLTRSSRTNGQPLLREAELRELSEALRMLHARMLPQWGARANAADVEFLITADRRVVILQARPFTLAWNDAQR